MVIVDKIDAETKLAPPLLNRFEKQTFDRCEESSGVSLCCNLSSGFSFVHRKDVLKEDQKIILERLKKFCTSFALEGGSDEPNFNTMRRAFCGYHSEMLSSLVLATCDKRAARGSDPFEESDVDLSQEDKYIREQEEILQECVRKVSFSINFLPSHFIIAMFVFFFVLVFILLKRHSGWLRPKPHVAL